MLSNQGAMKMTKWGSKESRDDEVRKYFNPGIWSLKNENDCEQNLHKDKCGEKFYNLI